MGEISITNDIVNTLEALFPHGTDPDILRRCLSSDFSPREVLAELNRLVDVGVVTSSLKDDLSSLKFKLVTK